MKSIHLSIHFTERVATQSVYITIAYEYQPFLTPERIYFLALDKEKKTISTVDATCAAAHCCADASLYVGTKEKKGFCLDLLEKPYLRIKR